MEKLRKTFAVLLSLALLAAILLFTGAFSRSLSADSSSVMKGYREPQSEGVKNTITNALYMYNVFWTPLENVTGWTSYQVSTRQFVKGHTYRGIPYGQPVHEGAYVGSVASVRDFVNAAKDPSSKLYTDRGENTWYYTSENGPIWYSPFYSNDCSGFVSAAMRIKRHTTRDIGSNSEMFPVKGTDVLKAKPGDLINSHEGGHVIMVLDVVYDRRGGNVISIVTIEQTPDIIVVRSYGAGGTNGSLGKLQERMDAGKYYLCRYIDIDSVGLMNGALEDLPKIVNSVTEPSSIMSVDKPCEGTLYVDLSKDSFLLHGFSLTGTNVNRFEYSIDGGPFRTIDGTKVYSELYAPVWGFSYLEGNGNGYFYDTISTTGLSEGSRFVIKASCADGTEHTVADLIVKQAPDSVAFDACLESYGRQYGSMSIPEINEDSSLITLNGWCMSKDIVRFELKVDDGLWYQLGPRFRQDVFDYIGYEYRTCIECNAFECGVDLSSLSGGDHTVTLRGVASDGLTFTVVKVIAKTQNIAPFLFASVASVIAIILILTVIIMLTKNKKKRSAGSKDEAGKDKNNVKSILEEELHSDHSDGAEI
ncbi:MAG: hypothetical protein J6112_09765 [Clostridia bacterium]|nr:hypothetical protein [Clostridia bacterium]